MIKKIVAGVLALLVLVLAGYKLFFSNDNVPKQISQVRENLTSYHMEGTMDVTNNEDIRSFYVEVDYKKEDNQDFFRISILDKNINQEQIMLRNKDGVYVLTPSLNQVYTFKGDYPLNSQKPYLFHSMLEALDGDYELEKVSDGYLLSFVPKYENSPTWVKEDIKLSSDFKPVWVNIYDNNNSLVCSINFSKVDFDVSLSDDDFNVEMNMKKSQENVKTEVNKTIDDLPLMVVDNQVSSSLNQQTEATVDGNTVFILSYTGNQNFTIIQSLMTQSEEISYSEVSGNLVNFDKGVGFYNNQYLTYMYNGVKYEIYSDSLEVNEMIEIVSSLDEVTIK